MFRNKPWFCSFIFILMVAGCTSGHKESAIIQLTHSGMGHTLHHNGVFSADGQWIVFDGRNEDTRIGETSVIGVVNLHTGEEKMIYQTKNPTRYGPGVGAASFSPAANRVIFIHGLMHADKELPYDISRRTGVAVDLERPYQPVFMDARDQTPPYTPGSLRGGTHSHCWSGDGRMISFTYNDALVEPGLRTVGVMLNAGAPVLTDRAAGNNDGALYAVVVAAVVSQPRPGSDEISKAFDECWVGSSGYTNSKGHRIPYAIAFQGNTRNEKGETIAEIFIADIAAAGVLNDTAAVGFPGERPHVPGGAYVQRISHTAKGLSPVRHWLRSSPDGRLIYALAPDENGVAQIISCTVNGGRIRYLTRNTAPVDYPFNLDKEGNHIAYIMNNNVYLLDLRTNKNKRLTSNQPEDPKVAGAPSFSPDGRMVVFNQYVAQGAAQWLQIKAVVLHE
ncbi:DUF3748 domain-containing protein [Niabella sp. CC-SYL272]|uniref:DUF3748 domain-containing protein n=1 Tax=Niabella agricola TaxID=2891571 RepID=UPI001F305D27|nr:DUF3748 domain-containing protein [Niabella agricola]MCF3108847.1 DUF3748 domain-containing protein [Niabella agricola]